MLGVWVLSEEYTSSLLVMLVFFNVPAVYVGIQAHRVRMTCPCS